MSRRGVSSGRSTCQGPDGLPGGDEGRQRLGPGAEADDQFAAARAGSPASSPSAICLRCWSLIPMWNQSRIGGSRTPAPASMRRSPGQPSVKAVNTVSPVRPTAGATQVVSPLFSDRGWGVEWILRLAAALGEGACVDIMEISKPDDLGDIANLGLTLAEAKQLLAGVQREISTAQAREHPPFCNSPRKRSLSP